HPGDRDDLRAAALCQDPVPQGGHPMVLVPRHHRPGHRHLCHGPDARQPADAEHHSHSDSGHGADRRPGG
ncbi:hypothetical protein HHFLNI_HHFLNI_05310, partial [Dysosmobacter welbionis]